MWIVLVMVHLWLSLCASFNLPSEQFNLDLYGIPGGVEDDRIVRWSPGIKPSVFIEKVPHWPSAGALRKLGLITAVVPMDDYGLEVLVLHRGDRKWDLNTFNTQNTLEDTSKGPIKENVLFRLQDGELVEESLSDLFYLPHGLTVDREGNVWITDVGMHQVFKFGPDKSLLMTLGEKFIPGSDEKHFCAPTHVAVASNGDFFIADGYCNSRILKFHPNGTVIAEWGHETKNLISPGPHMLLVPHEMALIEEQDKLCVADRNDERVVCYCAGLRPETRKRTGEYLFEIRENGPVFGIAISPVANALLSLVNVDEEARLYTVHMYDLDTNEPLGTLNDEQDVFTDAHSISACPSSEELGCIIVNSLRTPTEREKKGLPDDASRIWYFTVSAYG